MLQQQAEHHSKKKKKAWTAMTMRTNSPGKQVSARGKKEHAPEPQKCQQ
jgi:hypothetical protein